jgi:hypothetical protein
MTDRPRKKIGFAPWTEQIARSMLMAEPPAIGEAARSRAR